MQCSGVLVLLVVVASIYSSSAFFFGSTPDPDWNGLRASFGVNPLSSFVWLPRTRQEAAAHGWTPDTSAGACGVSGTAFNGNRYRNNDGDPATMVLFDKNGFIAGIQAGIPKNETSFYPGPQHAKYGVFTEEAQLWVITAYFTEPSTICTNGRTQAEFESEGTGSLLAIQTGPTPDTLMRAPMSESDVTSTTKYVLGKCFYGMGRHYWYDITKDMSCDDAYPVFLMYNKGKLTAFGWAFNAYYETSTKWEHPTRSVFSNFFNTVPDCLGVDQKVTTLHMYLTNDPWFNRC